MFVRRRRVARHNHLGPIGRTVHDGDGEFDLDDLDAVDLDVNQHIVDDGVDYNGRSSGRRRGTGSAAVELSIAAFRTCLAALPNCDVGTLANTRAGDMLRVNKERIDEWNAAGYVLRDGDQFREVVESVIFLDEMLTRARVVTCGADGSKLVLPGAGPNGSDVVVDGAYTSGRSEWDVRLDVDGVWRPYAAPALGPTESRDICPPA